MSLFDIYKAKNLGMCPDSLLISVLGKAMRGSHIAVIDKIPYLKRKTANGSNVSSECKDTLVGGSLVWNQIAHPFSTSHWTAESGVSAQWNNGEVVFSCSSPNNGIAVKSDTIAVQADHKYLISVQVNSAVAISEIDVGNGANGFESYVIGSISSSETGKWKTVRSIKNAPANKASAAFYIFPRGTSYSDLKIKNIMLIDLTMLFGSIIADEIYSLEKSVEGKGTKWFFDLFTAEYYEYNNGTLKSVENVVSRDTIGLNQWDEEWELGLIYNDTGLNRESTDYIRSKNYIPVFPSTEYYIKLPVGDAPLYFYDADHNYITPYFGGAAGKFITPANAHFMRLRLGGNYGTVYNNDICVNISGEHDGEYAPYDKHSYPLDDSITLRGIPKIADGNLYYDGDVYKSNGEVTRKYGIRAYQDGDSTDGSTMVTDGINTVYKLDTTTIESADAFAAEQIVDAYGTEEYVTNNQSGISIPVGHETQYKIIGD